MVADSTTTYYGQMEKLEKNEHYMQFLSGEKCIMLATKAFGMGIDIDNIVNIVHLHLQATYVIMSRKSAVQHGNLIWKVMQSMSTIREISNTSIVCTDCQPLKKINWWGSLEK